MEHQQRTAKNEQGSSQQQNEGTSQLNVEEPWQACTAATTSDGLQGSIGRGEALVPASW